MNSALTIFFCALAVLVAGWTFLRWKKKTGGWPPGVIAKVERDRSARERVRQTYPGLFQKVSEAMFKHDLIGINFETNTDEYEPEAGTVILRLKECSSAKDVLEVIHEEFSIWFGSDVVGDRSRYESLSEEVWSLWQEETEPGSPANAAKLHR